MGLLHGGKRVWTEKGIISNNTLGGINILVCVSFTIKKY
jgi:hypothetical protein